MKWWAAGVSSSGLVAFFLFFPLHATLIVSTASDGTELFCTPLAEGEEFIFSFTHSVNRRPVFDTIRREGDHLFIVKSRFDSFGAGMPEASTDKGKLILGQDGWLEWIVNQPVREITFFVGWVANHTLKIKGKDITLTDLAEPGTLLALRAGRSSLYDLWGGRCTK